MTPVRASVVDHCPEEGRYGDCHSACLASLLDLPLEDVPVFFDDRPSAECHEHVERWLASRGLAQVSVLFHARHSLDEVLLCVKNTNPDVYYILGVTSARGLGHSVVACGGEVVHDPTYNGDQHEYGPMSDGHWWVTYLVPSSMRRVRS